MMVHWEAGICVNVSGSKLYPSLAREHVVP